MKTPLCLLFSIAAIALRAQSIDAIQTNWAKVQLNVSYDASLWPFVTPVLNADNDQIWPPVPVTNSMVAFSVTNLPSDASAAVTSTGVTNGVAYFTLSLPGTGFDTNGMFRLTPFTVTNSTDSTFGHGAGILCADSNYIYISVATNLWKRAALSAW